MRDRLTNLMDNTISRVLALIIYSLLLAGLSFVASRLVDPMWRKAVLTAVIVVFCVGSVSFAFLCRKAKPIPRLAVLAVFSLFTSIIGVYLLWAGEWASAPSAVPSVSSAADNLVKRFDFETSATGWETMDVLDKDRNRIETIEDAATLSVDEAERGVAYELQLIPGQWSYGTVQYKDPVKADVIAAQFFLSDTAGIEHNKVAISVLYEPTARAALYSEEMDISLGAWTEILLDLRGIYDSHGIPLSHRGLYLEIEYGLKGDQSAKPTTVEARLDNVACYQGAGSQTRREYLVSDLPLQIGRTDHFEDSDDPIDTEGWMAFPLVGEHTIEVCNQAEFAHSDDHSLCLEVDIDKYDPQLSPNEYGGIGLMGVELQDVKAVVVWVKTPKGAPSLTSHIAAADQNGIYHYSQKEELVPGEWTRIFLGSYRLHSGCPMSEWDGTVHELYVNAWSDAGYTGPIYFDDITIYTGGEDGS